jgi:hypothetical protein
MLLFWAKTGLYILVIYLVLFGPAWHRPNRAKEYIIFLKGK